MEIRRRGTTRVLATVTALSLSLLLSLSLTACGMLREQELGPPVVRIQPQLSTCRLPDPRGRELRSVTEGELSTALDCLESKLDSAFSQVRGSRPEELTLSELKALHREKLVDIQIESEAHWSLLGHVLALFHPEGKACLSKRAMKRFIDVARRHVPLALDWARSQDPSTGSYPRESVSPLLERTLHAAKDFVDLLSPDWKMTLDQARDLTRQAVDSLSRLDDGRESARAVGPTYDLPVILDRVEAVWILKSAVLPDPAGHGPRGDLRASGLRALLHAALDAAALMPGTRRWAVYSLMPNELPGGLEAEWQQAIAPLAAYFRDNPFASIESDLLAWSLRKLGASGGLPELAPDLVRIAQRLSAPRTTHGFHPAALVPLLQRAGSLASQLTGAAPAFASCRGYSTWSCRIRLREALANPVLRRIALKGPDNFWQYDTSNPFPDRALDATLNWDMAWMRLVKRNLVTKLFDVFDQDHDGKLPMHGRYEEDVRETLDLAYTFLRFLAFGSLRGEGNKREQQVPTFITVKPGSLYRLMGLLGDRWMPDGDRDGALNADEFFSVVQVYEEIQRNADAVLYAGGNLNAWIAPEHVDRNGTPLDFTKLVYERTDFIHRLGEGLSRVLPASRRTLEELGQPTARSLFHGLVGTAARRPLTVIRQYHSPDNTPRVTLERYVDAREALAPVAIVTALEKLMIGCDTNEDLRLDWREMDCAVPPILEAGYQVISSALVELDPGVHDLARLLLVFLQRRGVPLALAKLMLANGSISRLDGPTWGDVESWLNGRSGADWAAVARWLAGLGAESGVELERLQDRARQRYGICDDSPRDGRLAGPRELDCFARLAAEDASRAAPGFVPEGIAARALDRFALTLEAEIFKLGLKLGVQTESDLDALMTRLSVSTTPTKILRLLEELLRRNEPLPPQPPPSMGGPPP